MRWKALFRRKNIDQIIQDAAILAEGEKGLKKSLGVWDLTSFGIAAVLGAGIFSTIGNASVNGGPAVIFLFLFTAIACAFSALCYAEFASQIPVSGSAYTYAYFSFGELIAWIIGWDLLMEYAIGDIVIAISWSQYFTGFLSSYGIQIPEYLTMDFLSASRGFHEVTAWLAKGHTLETVTSAVSSPVALKGYIAWTSAPLLFGLPVVCDLPALLITALVTWIVFIGIEDSKKVSHFFVGLKVFVILLVIGIGALYVHPSNWSPFAPNGLSGVLKGASAVFFAYIGFDAISTTAEECKNPQRDLPRGMIYTLLICTVLYSLLALVLTGMVNYKTLGVGDPLAFVFGPEGVNVPWLSGFISVSAIAALSSVLLVFQLGQTRIWMAMSRDGLLPKVFSSIHPRYKTPWVSTLVAGVLVAIPSIFMNLTEVTDLNSIGTLFAFILVCAGALRFDPKGKRSHKFRIPYFNAKIAFPLIMAATLFGIIYFNPEGASQFFSLEGAISQKIPLIVFSVFMLILSVLCILKNLSLIPVLGLASCSYLISELGLTNWIRFGVWLIIGFFMYFFYGFKSSRLNMRKRASPS